MAVVDSDVKAVIDTARDTTPFIATANMVVTEELVDSGLSADRLNAITLYLAAHFVCVTEEKGGLQRSKQGEGEDVYKIPAAGTSGFSSTRYGQQAMILDTTGTIAAMAAGTGLKAKFEFIPVSNYHFGVATEDAGTIDPFNE